MSGTTLKYVRHSVAGFVVWPKNYDEVHHAHIGRLLCRNPNLDHGEIMSAGFIDWNASGIPICRGRSESLNIDSRPDDTEALLAEWGIRQGLTAQPMMHKDAQHGRARPGVLALLVLALLCIAPAARAQSFSDRVISEFREGQGIVHWISEHRPSTDTNNGNLGFGVKTKSGYVAGCYHNSYYIPGCYVGWESPEWIPRVAFSFEMIKGYKLVSGKEWTPALFLPNVRLLTLTRGELADLGLSLPETSLHVLVVPTFKDGRMDVGLLHFLTATRF